MKGKKRPKVRRTWGVSPVSRVVESRKVYKRARSKKEERRAKRAAEE